MSQLEAKVYAELCAAVEEMIEVIHADGRRDALPYVELCEAETQPLKVVDGLIEYVAEDVHVNDRADFGVLVRAGHFARGLVTVIAEVLEMGADLVRHLEGVQCRIRGRRGRRCRRGCSGRHCLHHELFLALLEAAQDGIGDLAVHRDVAFAGTGEGVRRFGGVGVGEMGVMGIMGVMSVRGANRDGVAE